MKKKIICILIPAHWAAFMGGAQYQAKCIIEQLVKSSNNYEIYYLARRVSEDFKSNDYNVVKVAEPDGYRRYGYFFDIFDLIKLLKKIKPDVIYQRVACGYTGIAALYASRNKCKLVFHIAHDTDVIPFDMNFTKDLPFKYLEKKLVEFGIRHADKIIAQTQNQSNLLLNNYNIKVTAIIPNFHPRPKENIVKKDGIKIMWIANFKPIKQPEIFVNLAKDMQHFRHVNFIMIGSCGATHMSYLDLFNDIDSLDNIEYLGSKSQDEVNSNLLDAHIFVNTSTSEGFANTFIQAWMRKVPVVSLNVNPDNILNDFNIGIFSGNYKKMLADLIYLVENPEVRLKMGESAQKYAFNNHSEKNALKIQKIIND